MMPEDAQRFRQHHDDEASFEPNPPTEASYAFARQRLASDERFMAHIIHERQRRLGVSDEAITQELGIPVAQLGPLSLWLRPAATPNEQFQADVKRISERFNLDRDALTRIVREHDFYKTFRGAKSDRQLLAAARDHDAPPDETADDRPQPPADSPTPPSQDREP